MKIICESCETIFKAEIVKGMTNCPVCGAVFEEKEEQKNIEIQKNKKEEIEENIMYFDSIVVLDEAPQYSYVSIHCKECERDNSLELDNFDEIVDEKYVVLKKGVGIKCKGCGKEHKFRKIFYKSYNEEIEINEEGGLMYLDEVNIYDNSPEYSDVSIYCRECGETNYLELDECEEIVDEKYIILKKGAFVRCQGCGKEQKPRKILYKEKDRPSEVLMPHCPICGSIVLKKISLTSKVVTTAALGVLANPHNSKTYECRNCGYKF